MKELKIQDKISYTMILLISAFFVTDVLLYGINAITGSDYLGLNKISLTMLYYAISFVYLFNIVFLHSIKNIRFWKLFFYAGIVIFLFKNISRLLSYIALPEPEKIFAILFGNLVFCLFLHANYQYVFMLHKDVVK